VGYAGGTRPAPTYHSLGDHTETVQIDFDPARISYAQLLEIFWRSHNPTSRSWSRQYMAAVFYHDEAQQQLAEESRRREAAKVQGKRIATEILPFTGFHRAENYHQKYYLRQERQLLRELERIYPDNARLVDSTAAARINGYLGGNGSTDSLEDELEQLGLSEEGRRTLRHIAERTRN
jgi:methionine-S-sulfoxide reductase